MMRQTHSMAKQRVLQRSAVKGPPASGRASNTDESSSLAPSASSSSCFTSTETRQSDKNQGQSSTTPNLHPVRSDRRIQPTTACGQHILAELEPVSQFPSGGAGCHHVDQDLLDVPPQTRIRLLIQQSKQHPFQTHLLQGDLCTGEQCLVA